MFSSSSMLHVNIFTVGQSVGRLWRHSGIVHWPVCLYSIGVHGADPRLHHCVDKEVLWPEPERDKVKVNSSEACK